ncbi:MAG: ABC transporter permease subunit [Geobacter sp.]|nr:ABC transporter permease subunit [Geobacter sp.]
MQLLWPIAIITFKEGIRNRSIYGISLLALLMLLANFVISGMVAQEVSKVAVDIALSAISFSGLLLVLFVGINLMAKDLDRKTIYMVMAKPISRSQYLIGKYIGVILLITVCMSLLSFFAAVSLLLIKFGHPTFFQRFSWLMVGLSFFFTTLMLILVAALSFLFSSFTSTSFLTFILTIISYIIGMSLNDVKALVEAPQSVGITVSPVTVKIVQAAYYVFPNLSLFDIKLQAAHGLPVPVTYVIGIVAYTMVYSVIVMTMACLIFRKKEFP